MEGLIMAGQLLLGLGLLVFIHELGHFLAARAFGIKVEKFYIFFDFGDFAIFKKQVGDTEYGLGWFPLGGYVKISGMIDESFDQEQLDKEPQEWEFRSKPAWQRFIVMIAGIVMNIILGVLIFMFWLNQFKESYLPPENVTTGIYAYELGQKLGFENGDKLVAINGDTSERMIDFLTTAAMFEPIYTVNRSGKRVDICLPFEMNHLMPEHKGLFIGLENFTFAIDSVLPGKAADEAGMKKGDVITNVEDDTVMVFGDLRVALLKHKKEIVDITVMRNGQSLVLSIAVNEKGMINVVPTKPELQVVDYNFANSFRFAVKDGWEAVYYNAIGLGQTATGKRNARESIQSPIAIAGFYGGVWDWGRFWKLTGLISFVLAFMNFLPIPALDGGHIMFIIIEVIQGKPVSEKILERAQIFGIIVIMALMLFAFGNDILKKFGI